MESRLLATPSQSNKYIGVQPPRVLRYTICNCISTHPGHARTCGLGGFCRRVLAHHSGGFTQWDREGVRSRQKANLCVSAGSRAKSLNLQRADPRCVHISQSICRHVGVSHAQCYVTHPEMQSALMALDEEPTFCDLTKMLRRWLPRPCFSMQGSPRMSVLQ
jgi:hypothetical protein